MRFTCLGVPVVEDTFPGPSAISDGSAGSFPRRLISPVSPPGTHSILGRQLASAEALPSDELFSR